MTAKRLTKEDIRNTTGILNPLGHVVLAFKDDAVTAEAVAAPRAAGSAEEDILVYKAEEATPRLRERVQTVSQAAGFGYEITLMRRYLALAERGRRLAGVYAPDEKHAVPDDGGRQAVPCPVARCATTGWPRRPDLAARRRAWLG